MLFRSFHAVQCDIRAPEIARELPAQDALVHLAYVVLRGHARESAMYETNVDASYRLLLAAREAGVRRIIHLSSAAVYGAGAQLTEDAPFAPLPGFLYAQHKAQLESLLAANLPQCVCLRPHVILGPHAQPVFRQMLSLPFYPRLRDTNARPQLQCVHEADVAQAILQAIARDVQGAFNLAADDAFDYADAIRRHYRWALPLPFGAAAAAVYTAWRLTGWGGEPAWIDGLRATLTLDCTRAREFLDWHPRYSARDAIAQTLRPRI